MYTIDRSTVNDEKREKNASAQRRTHLTGFQPERMDFHAYIIIYICVRTGCKMRLECVVCACFFFFVERKMNCESLIQTSNSLLSKSQTRFYRNSAGTMVSNVVARSSLDDDEEEDAADEEEEDANKTVRATHSPNNAW